MGEITPEIIIGNELSKKEVFVLVEEWRCELGFFVDEINIEKPWGAYWRISERQTERFIDLFFPELKEKLLDGQQNLSPKFLLMAPHQRLSWQYHNFRAEEWVMVAGPLGVKVSETDLEPKETMICETGESIDLGRGVRHRLIGTEGWGLVAEIWVHTDSDNPSSESDIVRVQDDYARK